MWLLHTLNHTSAGALITPETGYGDALHQPLVPTTTRTAVLVMREAYRRRRRPLSSGAQGAARYSSGWAQKTRRGGTEGADLRRSAAVQQRPSASMAQTTSSCQDISPPAGEACRHHTASVRHEKAASDVVASAPVVGGSATRITLNWVVRNIRCVPATTRKTALVMRAAYHPSPLPSGAQVALRYSPGWVQKASVGGTEGTRVMDDDQEKAVAAVHDDQGLVDPVDWFRAKGALPPLP
jgi:hypothetical protein